MSHSEGSVQKTLLEQAIIWFRSQFRQQLVNPLESQFPNYPFPGEIQAILGRTDQILQEIQGWQGDPIPVAQLGNKLSTSDLSRPQLLKQILSIYRRSRAAEAERFTEKTFHVELTDTLERDVKALDNLVNEAWVQTIPPLRLPRLKDILPIQYLEAATGGLVALAPRQYDEKFHILQAPNLFLQDLAYFRNQCENREVPLAIAFLDIDHFKDFNERHSETKVDRNLLSRFMQVIEAHVFYHGYAYRQGGDEYLILLPSMSRKFALLFLDELRCKLASLDYQGIDGHTTVSIGLCLAEPDCPFTDRELRDRANLAKKEAKSKGRNRIAYYEGPRLIQEDLRVFVPEQPAAAPS